MYAVPASLSDGDFQLSQTRDRSVIQVYGQEHVIEDILMKIKKKKKKKKKKKIIDEFRDHLP